MTRVSDKPSLKQRIYDFFPTLERGERKKLVERISIGADGGVDFTVMMLLAATLASLGLLQGSTAVVIGAMLVAPLMGPLVAAGLALTQGNLTLFRSALSVSVSGIFLGLGVSLFLGAMNPGFEASMEIEARGNPDVLDLGIAFASGMVAAYAMGRPNVSGTLAGVAIAAALLPPLAVVGIGLTNDEMIIAGNATILFVTNLVAIILGAALIFRLLGMHVSISEAEKSRWVRRATMSFALLAVILAAPLLVNMLEKGRAGQVRPAIYPVSADVRNAVWDYIGNHPDLELIGMARHSVEPETGITLMVTTSGPLKSNVTDELIQIVRAARGDKDAIVRVFTLLEAPLADPE
jgi:uncharacterized hydrophobic protein (TIGR00271 family)